MYIIEGNIGVGKSTFLEALSSIDPQLEIIPEPVASWTENSFGKSLLAHFYENPSRWAYTLETFAMMRRAIEHQAQHAHANPYRLMERSVYSGHHCFAYNGFESGYFTDIEWSMYNEWMTFLIEESCNPPRGFIYLRAEPAICFKRLKKRNREGEGAISLEYLEAIHQRHESFLLEKKDVAKTIKNIPTLVLDCSVSLVENRSVARLHFESFHEFFKATSSSI